MKRIIGIALAATAFLLANPAPGFTQGGHRSGGTPSSGGHSSGGYSHGGYSHGGYSHGGYSHGGYSHGGYSHGGYSHGGYYHGGGGYYRGGGGYYRGGGGYYGSIWIGPGWGYWGWGPAYPFYYPYSYPYYAPPAVIQQSPTQFIQRDQETDEQNYWYFCRKPEGYYPYVKRCPNGWLRVIPSEAPPDLRK
jgi:hypothetical protein